MKVFVLTLVIYFCLICNSSAISGTLETTETEEKEVEGSFTLILYGGRDMNDIERLAILDLEEDKYTFEPHAPEFDYKVTKGLDGKEALEKADRFVSDNPSFWRSQLSKIIDEKGSVIGYELRPLYIPFIYGVSDVLEVHYSLKGEKVRIDIRIIPSVERALPERTLVSSLKP